MVEEYQHDLHGYYPCRVNDYYYGVQNNEAFNSNRNIRPTMNNEQDVAENLNKLPTLGLKLTRTPSFIELVEKKINPNTSQFKQSRSDQEKLKASNFSASYLRIGNWQRWSRNEGELVAKCYFSKKKLVWEILEGGLKQKIELQWSDLSAIRADIRENHPGILEIELNTRPTFYIETDPQPRKHTIWKSATDFTGGEASSYRRHYVVFPPGTLERHYEKLLQCDQRLFELSLKPFPSSQSPNFEVDYFRLVDFNASRPETSNHSECFGFSISPDSPCNALVYDHTRQTALMDSTSPVSDDRTHNNIQWGDRGTGYERFSRNVMNHTHGITYNNQSYYNNNMASYNHNLLYEIENHLLSDSGVHEVCDEVYCMQRVGSFAALFNLSREDGN